MTLHQNYKNGLGSSLVSVVDLSDLCFTKECKERQAQTELQKQQILANALESTAKNVFDDTTKTLDTVKYVAYGIGGIAIIGLIIYAFKPATPTKRKK